MTDKELRRLTRSNLIELLILERREIDRLNAECMRLNEALKAVDAVRQPQKPKHK
ncbi:MAG: hypothetical protein IJM71_06590 [Clostridia bacterium]|nr:hypothetical protein [Clostridia bacterium]